MFECQRCGSILEKKPEKLTFKCIICKDIKFERSLLIPIEREVKKNFHRAIDSRFGSILKDLYVFGSYAEGSQKSCDIDFLYTYNNAKNSEVIENVKEELFLQVERDEKEYNFITGKRAIWGQHYTKGFLKCLNKQDKWNKYFFDYRTCQEYPDCLEECYEQDNCFLPDNDYKADIHNFCLNQCNSEDAINHGIPDCFFNFRTKCADLEFHISDEIQSEIVTILRENADITFNRSGLNIKILHINSSSSLKNFQEFNIKSGENRSCLFIELNHHNSINHDLKIGSAKIEEIMGSKNSIKIISKELPKLIQFEADLKKIYRESKDNLKKLDFRSYQNLINYIKSDEFKQLEVESQEILKDMGNTFSKIKTLFTEIERNKDGFIRILNFELNSQNLKCNYRKSYFTHLIRIIYYLKKENRMIGNNRIKW